MLQCAQTLQPLAAAVVQLEISASERGWVLSKRGSLEGNLRGSRKVCLNEIPLCFVGTKPCLQRLVQH